MEKYTIEFSSTTSLVMHHKGDQNSSSQRKGIGIEQYEATRKKESSY